MLTSNRSLQIIDRRANESILIDQQLTVTVIEVTGDAVVLEIAGPDGDVERVMLHCHTPGAREAALVGCDPVCC